MRSSSQAPSVLCRLVVAAVLSACAMSSYVSVSYTAFTLWHCAAWDSRDYTLPRP